MRQSYPTPAGSCRRRLTREPSATGVCRRLDRRVQIPEARHVPGTRAVRRLTIFDGRKKTSGGHEATPDASGGRLKSQGSLATGPVYQPQRLSDASASGSICDLTLLPTLDYMPHGSCESW